MKKHVVFVFAAMLAAGLWSCSNSTKSEGKAADSVCVDGCDNLVDSVAQDVARGGDDGFDVDVKAEAAGPGENKPCHVSGCKCKFGYAGNWDAKYCNKCNHEMSKHY